MMKHFCLKTEWFDVGDCATMTVVLKETYLGTPGTRYRYMLTNLACSITNQQINRGNGITLRFRDYTIDRLGVMAQKAEKMLLKIMN